VAWIAGRPDDRDTDFRAHQARTLFDAGRYDEAAATWPGHFGPERAVTRQLARSPDDHRAAASRLRKRERTLYLNAFQSALFNQLLERVIAERLETPPFGLLPGYKIKANDAVWHDPEIVLSALGGIDPGPAFRRERLKGERRAFRLFPVIEQSWEEQLIWRFSLPSGGYATTILRELTKQDPAIARL